jgi:Glycosyltransferase family 92
MTRWLNIFFCNSKIFIFTLAFVSITITLHNLSLNSISHLLRTLDGNSWILPSKSESESIQGTTSLQTAQSPLNTTTYKSQETETPIYPSHVLFRSFLSDPMHHISTVEGKLLPGLFHLDTLFLLGLRITTSNEAINDQVHIDVFGFPGDFVGNSPNRYCDVHSLPRQWNLSTYRMFHRGRRRLFCQLECQFPQDSFAKECGVPIPMTFIPLQSYDRNQNRHSLIWRCNVTNHLTKSFLLQHAAETSSSQSIRVTLYLKDKVLPRRKSLNIQPFTQIDIPLHTAVAGYGGPQIRHAQKGYFSHRQQKSSIHVGMCVSIYDPRPAIYIPEFLQHHINVGIEHFMIGMDANLKSSELLLVEKVIRPYIDEGRVVLQAFGLRDYFTCDTDVSKLQFYHQCLYYFKGLTDYIVTWDVDEYWIPPDRPNMLEGNQSKLQHLSVNDSDEEKGMFGINNSLLLHGILMNQFDSPSYSSFVRNETLWKESNYSKSLSMHDIIQAVNAYHQSQPECKGRWCFHLFPSYSVARKVQDKRTNLVATGFEYRDIERNLIWRKGLVQTRFAMMNGFHVAGSCTYPDTSDYFETEAHPQTCHSLYGKVDVFGTMHHFLSLMSTNDRFLMNETNRWTKDEYVSRYGMTVMSQLEREQRLPPLP